MGTCVQRKVLGSALRDALAGGDGGREGGSPERARVYTHGLFTVVQWKPTQHCREIILP